MSLYQRTFTTYFQKKHRKENEKEKSTTLKWVNKQKSKTELVHIGFLYIYKIVDNLVYRKTTKKIPVFGHGISHIEQDAWELTKLTPQDVYTMRDNFLKAFFNIEPKS